MIKAARARAKRPRIRTTRYVERSATNSHLDPLADPPRTNDFLRTVVPFLKQLD